MSVDHDHAQPRSLTLEPINGESLIGYMFRLALYRRLPSAWFLAASCGFDRYTDRPEPDWLSALADLAGVSRETLVAVSKGPPNAHYGWWRGQRFNHSVIERRGSADRRVCPACLSESAHHRAIWDIKYIAVCPIHLCILVDQCPGCGMALRWRGRDLGRCRCGQDLRTIVSPGVSEADAISTAAVYGLLDDPRFHAEADKVRTMAPFQDLIGSDIADFLFRLGLERLGRRGKVFSTESVGDLAWEAHVALRLGLEAIADWPDGFTREIDAMRERWGGRTGQSLYRCVGAIEVWLSRLQEGSRGAVIGAVVDEYRRQDAALRGVRLPAKQARRPC